MIGAVLFLAQGAVNMAHEFMPALKMSATVNNLTKPSFVVVNSIGGVVPVKNMSAYCASKHALAGFAECLRLEAETMGVHVGQVHPGIVNSDLMENAEFKGNNAAEARKQMNQMLRTPVAQSPEEVANAVWDCATGKQLPDPSPPPLPARAAASQGHVFER
jgi:NAD(P)-dependent dehydrogenase (short-subunit alcohol dehydrogenase family)